MAVVEQSVVRSLPTNHPNIVRFHDAGISKAENEIRYYILSEYCPSNVLKKMSAAMVSWFHLPLEDPFSGILSVVVSRIFMYMLR